MVHMRAIPAAVEKLVVSPLPPLGTTQLWVAWPVLATLWIFLDVFVAAFTESAAPKDADLFRQLGQIIDWWRYNAPNQHMGCQRYLNEGL